MDLFQQDNKQEPLASRMRPKTLDDLVGQEEIVGKGRLLHRAIQADQLSSLIFYGPPGTGKTTLARIIAHTTKSQFLSLNAVLSGVKQVKEAIEKAKDALALYGRKTILFVDEVHRWNKAQQDALLPWVENGTVILIGATTENPHFEVNSALISRSRLFQLKPLGDEDLKEVARRAVKDPLRGFGKWKVEFEDGALEHLVTIADGDARSLLNALQLAVETTPEVFPPPEGTVIPISLETAEESIQQKAVLYDKEGDFHYDTISAFIKSIRGSDPDAVLYWLALMIRAGESPRFIFRRMLVLATEDIGLADPQALVIVNNAAAAFERMGMPEGVFPLTQAALYLATAPKSNSTLGIFDALKVVDSEKQGEVPNHLRDDSRDAKSFGHGVGYKYPHAFRNHWIVQQYLPGSLKGRVFYQPTAQGYEQDIQKDVLRRREAQLASVLLNESEESMAFSPGDSKRSEWMDRTFSGAGQRLIFVRENLFRFLKAKRTDRLIVLRDHSGLLTFEAFRTSPEGGVASLVKSRSSFEAISHLAEMLPETERPVVLEKDYLEPDSAEAVKKILPQAEAVLAYNPFKTAEEAVTCADWVSGILSNNGILCFALELPGEGTVLSDLLGDILSAEELKILKQAEASIYEPYRMLRSGLLQVFSHRGISFETDENLFTESRSLSTEIIEKWLGNQKKVGVLGSVLYEMNDEVYNAVKNSLTDLAEKGPVDWNRKITFFYGNRKMDGFNDNPTDNGTDD